jgi:hypothetical protein
MMLVIVPLETLIVTVDDTFEEWDLVLRQAMRRGSLLL